MAHNNKTYIKIGEVRALINEKAKNPELVPNNFGRIKY